MKYFFSIAIIFLASLAGFSQPTIQASIGAGSAANRVIVYVKPLAAVNGVLSTFQFSLAVPAAATPVPTATVIGTPAFGITWFIDPPIVEGGLRHYQFTTANSPAVVIGANVETFVVEVEFSGGPTTANDVSLQSFGDPGSGPGGSTGNIIFFCSGAANSTEGQLFYTRGGTSVINNASYSTPLASSATISGVILPLNWLSFNVVKQGRDGYLNWVVANDDANHHYEIQRSTNGTSFTTIATQNKLLTTTYNYTDAGIDILNAPVVYYRLKQLDINGKISYSDVRILRLDVKGNQISIFPNPVKEGFYVSIPFVNPDNRKVNLKLIAANGQVIATKNITTAQAANYYFGIKDMALASGQYNLQIIFEDKIMDTKKLYVSQ